MQHKDSSGAPALRALCQLAGDQAAGHGRDQRFAPATTTTTGRGWRPGWPVKAGVFGGLCLLAWVVLAAPWRAAPVTSTVAAVARPAAQSPAAVTAPLLAPGTTGLGDRVRWQGRELAIDIDQLHLPRAVALLADATHTTVVGADRLDTSALRHVTLHGRFTDIPSAWQRLLQQHAGFSISCGQASCNVWITSALNAASTAPSADAAGATPARQNANANGDPSGYSSDTGSSSQPASEEIESQPGGSC